MLADLQEVDISVAGESAAPRGVPTLPAPVMFGTPILRPIADEFLKVHAAAQTRLLPLDREVNLADEGVDVALRIAPLPDSSLIAQRIGEVQRALCASPAYITRHPPIRKPADLASHDCIAIAPNSPNEVWSFPPVPGSPMLRTVRVKPRLMVNAVDGEGACGSAPTRSIAKSGRGAWWCCCRRTSCRQCRSISSCRKAASRSPRSGPSSALPAKGPRPRSSRWSPLAVKRD
ncbi:MAG: LysR substrate-binding domain-containing protein [Hypericibacter sp.]